MICKNCKFFLRSDDNKHICLNPSFVYIGDGEKINDDGCGYGCPNCYDSDIYVGENFGCIHFIDKKDAEIYLNSFKKKMSK